MTRRLLAVLLVLLVVAGCTAQDYLAHTTHTVVESPLKIDGTVTDDLAYYDQATRTIHLDLKAIARFDDPAHHVLTWIRAHEGGHAIAFDIGLYIGNEPRPTKPDVPWPPEERAAQCVAEVMLGHGPPFTNPPTGYWDCPSNYVLFTRAVMANHGITP